MPEFPNGVFWVSLAALRDPDLLLETVGRTVGAAENLESHLAGRELLLLLDNFEQLVGAAPQLSSLLAAAPRVSALVTSRELLRIAGEVEYQVPPLAEREAVALFCARSGREPTPEAGELCGRLDNLPLAVELAAARARVLSPAQILERLSRRLDLLRGGRDAEARQRTLRAAIEWSHDLLGAEEKALFARLACFEGGCTLEAAEAVAGAEVDTLQDLVEKSLVRHAGERFSMLETIREFARERLAESGEAESLARRHAEFFAALAESAGLSVEAVAAGSGSTGYDLVIPERANLGARAGLPGRCGRARGVRAPGGLARAVLGDQRSRGGQTQAERSVWRPRQPPPALEVRVIRSLAGVTYIAGEFEAGVRLIEQALEGYRALGDRWGMAHMLFRLGVEAARLGDTNRARALCEESLAMDTDGFNVAQASSLLGDVAVGEGRYEEAFELFDRSADLAERIGFDWWRAGVLINAAEYALKLGRIDQAAPRAQAGLRIAHAMGDRQTTAFALSLHAWIAADAGEPDRAGHLWGAIEAEAARGRIGQWEGVSEEYAARLSPVAGPEFERARSQGRALPLDDAVELALSAPPWS